MERAEMKYALLAAAVLAAGSTAWAQQDAAPAGQPPAASSERGMRNPLAVLRLEDLASTRERPLFSPTRRPPPPPAEAPAPPPPPAVEEKAAAVEPPPFDLIGAVVGEAYNLVLLRNRSTNEVTRLREGDEKDGWRVGTVSLHSAAIERDGRVEMLAFPAASVPGAASAPMLAGAGPDGNVPDPTAVLDRPPDDAPPPQIEPPRLEPRHRMLRLNLNK
jgi:general secretion pathway protein N